MALEQPEDPREVPWHPRFAPKVVGQVEPLALFRKAFASGRPHHAWLVHGPKGIGKATLAYALAKEVLGGSEQSKRWIEAKAHPDLFVLERQLNDAKPLRKLKAEISVEDARALSAFLSRTSAGKWRVVIVDSADDLNTESANAILKLVEEPPGNTLILLISHQPNRLLRTLKSRCLWLQLNGLDDHEVRNLINDLPLDAKPQDEALEDAIAFSHGSPGKALDLLGSLGAAAFAQFAKLQRPKESELLAIANGFAARGSTWDQFAIFCKLLQDEVGRRAAGQQSQGLAEVHAKLGGMTRVAEGFNLDKRLAVLEQLTLVRDALKAT